MANAGVSNVNYEPVRHALATGGFFANVSVT
jgi:hypothetical protein